MATIATAVRIGFSITWMTLRRCLYILQQGVAPHAVGWGQHNSREPPRLSATTGRPTAHTLGPSATYTLKLMVLHQNESGMAPDGPPVKSHRMVLTGPVFPDSRIDLG